MQTSTYQDEARWWLGGLAIIKATAAQTAGRLSVIEVTEPPGSEAPLHVHHNEDEGFLVLEGSVTISVGAKTIEAGPGDFAWGPRGIPHRFVVGPDGCRMLFILTPGGFEEMVRAMSEPAAERVIPPPSEPDFERVAEIAAAHGCELLG